MATAEAQTDQDKANSKCISNTMIALREEMQGSVATELIKQERTKKKKRGRPNKRGKKSYYEKAIDEEDDNESDQSRQKAPSRPKRIEKRDVSIQPMQVDRSQTK